MSKWSPACVRLLGLLSMACLLLGGCQGSKIVRVTGTIRYHGNPVPNLVVKFVPAEGRSSTGFTDENGHYTLRYDKQHEGAVRGMHKVFFTIRPHTPQEEVEMREGKLNLPPDVKEILTKHGKDKPLSYEVVTNGQVINIDLD